MAARKVRIHPSALEETEAATDWYAKRSGKAAEAFLNELDRAIDRIAKHPEGYQQHEFGTRRGILRRFPT